MNYGKRGSKPMGEEHIAGSLSDTRLYPDEGLFLVDTGLIVCHSEDTGDDALRKFRFKD